MKAITILSLLIAITPTSIVFGQETPAAPPEITPPAGNVAFLTAHAVGTQNYICLPPATDAGSANTWTFLAPQATLSVKLGRFVQQVATHFLSAVPTDSPTAQPACTLSADGKQLYCPTWQSSFDSSAVWGSKAGSINAGTDASCPNAGSIPCLLLKAVATKPGTFGTGLFARTTYVQRLHTKGGSAPTTSCQIGALQFIPYTADYTFYTTDDQHDDVQNQR